MPEKRWRPYLEAGPRATTALRATVLKGSFLDDIEGFDAEFFGISPREAEFLDPQQRFALELAWEALAEAGIPPLSLRGSEAAVYMAANSNDYGRRLLEDLALTGAYAVNGTTYYGIANRVSYFLDLRGPSMAVDTACAGSLTALHLAAHALRAREVPLAIVGGVNIMATPALNVALDGAGAMSPDGRSKAFDEAGDGYGRGEGAGVVILKRLADARRDGDRVHALVRASIVAQDGRSDGMMAPNAEAQAAMLRQVYDRAGIAPGSVGYVEAHGTGTPAGDGSELAALADVFGGSRSAGDPCFVGSVKPNVGHVEGGSGITGVLKAILGMQRRRIPPSLHERPTTAIDWEASGLRLVDRVTPWPARDGEPLRAGVSSYGVGGTIAHLVLEEAPEQEPRLAAAAGAGAAVDSGTRERVMPISAASTAGLADLAGRIAAWVDAHPAVRLDSIGHTLALRRSHLAERLVVSAESPADLVRRLRAFADGRPQGIAATGRAASEPLDGVVWIFSGHGSQWSGMGRDLLDCDSDFADALDGLADVYADELGWTPRAALVGGGPWTGAEVQGLTYAVQVALAASLRARGLAPAAVIGHSVGEIAAAVVSGALDVREAARFACRRAASLAPLDGRGGMVMAPLGFAAARERLRGVAGVEAAISAGPHATVLSGDADTVAALADRWQADGLVMRPVDTGIAFHSRHVEQAVPRVREAAAQLRPRADAMPRYTTALPDARAGELSGPEYWVANLRRPVRFREAVEAAAADGYRRFLEVSSHPVVAHSVRETLAEIGLDGAHVVGSLRRGGDGRVNLTQSLGALFCSGAEVDWATLHPAGELLDLPSVAWQHRPYWIFDAEDGVRAGGGRGHDPASHSLLGGAMTVSGTPPRQVWQTHLDMASRPYPQGHELVGVEVTPAAAILNTFVAAAEHDGPVAVTDVVLRTPLAVVPPRIVQIVREDRMVSLSTRVPGAGEGDEWITHTTATLEPGATAPDGRIDVAALRSRLAAASGEAVHENFTRMGVNGYAFPWDLDELRRDENEQLAVLTIVPAPAEMASSWAHVIDGALTISAAVVAPEQASVLWMSRSIDRVVFDGPPPARILVHSVRSPQSPEDAVDVRVSGEDGRVVCEVHGLSFAAVDHLGTAVLPRDVVYEAAWQPLTDEDLAPGRRPHRVVLVGDAADTGRLAAQLSDAGARCVLVDMPTGRVDAAPGALRPDLFTEPGTVLVVPTMPKAGASVEDAAECATWLLVRTAQALIEVSSASEGAAGQRLWCLTRGVRAAGDDAALAHAPLWGVGRVIAGEQPQLWGGTVDLEAPGPVPSGTGARLLDVLSTAAGGEDVVSLTAVGTDVARLAAIERPAERAPLQCSPSGTVLITGGLGALGLEVARWLLDRGARRLLLAGRRGLPPRREWPAVSDPERRRQIDGVLALEALGATVGILALDVSNADQAAEALVPNPAGLPPITGVVHAAGVVNDRLVGDVDADGLREVFAAKVRGAMVLHRLFPPGSLDFFVLFSSCGQFARLSGQTTYAAANSFLDTLAAHRHRESRERSVSLGWTAWRGLGLSADIATTMLEANSRGLDAVSAAEAFGAWSFGDRFAAPYLAVLKVLPTPPEIPRPPMLRGLVAVDGGRGHEAVDVFTVSGDATEEAALASVTADVVQQVAAELNLDAGDVDLRRPLVEVGVDSVMTVALRVRLQRRYGFDLPPTILWARPTAASLAEHVFEQLVGAPEGVE